MAEDVGDAEPIADPALGWQQVDLRAEAFQRHVLRADDHGVPGLVEVFYISVDQGLDVILDGDGAESLAAARQLDRLANLDVSYDQLSARGAVALSRAQHLSSLTTLWIGANKLGAEGVKALTRSAVFANLE